MVREYVAAPPQQESINWRAPLQIADGRIFDVLQFQVCRCQPVEIHRMCIMEVMRRGYDFSHHFFHLYLYRTLFERGGMKDNEDSILTYARVQVWDYLNRYREPMPLSRYARPIVLRCE